MAERNLDIDRVLAFFSASLNGIPMDGGAKMSRIYAKHLLDWARSDYPGADPVKVVERLIHIAMGEEFHRRNCTSLGYIHRNKGKLVLIGKEQRKKQGGGGYRIVFE